MTQIVIVKTILEICGTRSELSKQESHTGKYDGGPDPVVSLIAEGLETLERYYNRCGRVEERSRSISGGGYR